MDIETSKIEITKLILDIEDPDLIEKIKRLLKNETKDFWNTLSKAQRKELELGIKQLDEGKRISFDDFIKKVS